MTSTELLRARRYDGAAVLHGRRDAERAGRLILQERDLAVLYDTWRYRFLTSDQLRTLHWGETRDPRTAQLRLRRLHDGSYLDRVRPLPRGGEGSFPWTYALGEAGFAELTRQGRLPRRTRYATLTVLDYGRLVHDVHLNGWILALRRIVGRGLVRWYGEREALVYPSRGARANQLHVLEHWTPREIATPLPVRPDAVLAVELPAGGRGHLLVEFDRTERPDKNFEKFRRYDSFLTWWGAESDWGQEAFVVFVCATEAVRDAFVRAADEHLRGYLTYPGAAEAEAAFIGRQRVLFVLEDDVYSGRLDGVRVSSVPGRENRRAVAEQIALPLRRSV